MVNDNLMQLTHTKHYLMNDNTMVQRSSTVTRKVPTRP